MARRERQSSGMAMPAELCEELPHRFERVEQMESWDAPAGALRKTTARVFTQYEHRPVKAFDQPAGDDPQYAAVPVRSREDQRGLSIVDRCTRALLEDDLDDFRFGLLALGVQFVQLRGERARAA